MSVNAKMIRKVASVEVGRRAFEELVLPRSMPVDEVLLQKAGSADPVLLSIAAALRPDCPLAAYEDIGGTYGETLGVSSRKD